MLQYLLLGFVDAVVGVDARLTLLHAWSRITSEAPPPPDPDPPDLDLPGEGSVLQARRPREAELLLHRSDRLAEKSSALGIQQRMTEEVLFNLDLEQLRRLVDREIPLALAALAAFHALVVMLTLGGEFYVQLNAAAITAGSDIRSLPYEPDETRMAAWVVALAFSVASFINLHVIWHLVRGGKR